MAPSPSAGQLVARSISHGRIAGAVVGSVLGFLLIFILVLPFILRAIREHRYHKKITAENAAMSMNESGYHGGPPGQAFHPLFYEAGAGSTTGPGADGTVASGPSEQGTKFGDNNSSEDGKAAVAGSPPPSSPVDGAPQTRTLAAHAPTVAAPPRAALPPGVAPINTNIPPFNGPPSAPYSGSQAPSLNQAVTFPTLGSQNAQNAQCAPRQRSATMRSTRSTSLSQKVENIAGRAAAVFRQGSGRSSPSRSPTMASNRGGDSARSPVEQNFNHYPQLPQLDHHTWLMRQQGIDDDSIGVSPGFFEVNTQYLTGASAEYYSGAPLSPPTDPSSHLMSPVSYAPEPPSRIATSLASMASAAALTGVASGSKMQKKPTASRTDSMRTVGTGEDLSPLPLSPASPLPGVQEGSRGIKQEAPSPDAQHTGERGISLSPPSGPGMATKELTPDTVDFSAHSPSYRPLVPSPELPAPGTVNPRDVWAPATDDERFIHKTAELDRIEQSPPPALSNTPPVGPAVIIRADEDQDLGAKNEAEQEEASIPVEASPQPVLPQQASPGLPVPEPSYATQSSVSTPAANVAISLTSAHPATLVSNDVVDNNNNNNNNIINDFSPQSIDDHTAPSSQSLDTDISTGQLNDADFNELMLGLDDRTAYNFALGENQQTSYIPDLSNNADITNVDSNPKLTPNLNLDLNNYNSSSSSSNNNSFNDFNDPNSFNNFNNFNSVIDTNQHNVNSVPGTLDSGINNTTSAGPHTMGAYSLGGVAAVNNVYHQPLPPQDGPMYWNMPNLQNMQNMQNMQTMQNMQNMPNMQSMQNMQSMPSNNIPTIAGPFMTPVTQPDYPNGIVGGPYAVPSSIMPDGTNGVNGMHMVDYSKTNNRQYSLQTPQSSPGQLPLNLNPANGTLPPGMIVPLTPSPQRMPHNFNSPLSVPGSSVPSRPVSPLSNQGSTPGQSSCMFSLQLRLFLSSNFNTFNTNNNTCSHLSPNVCMRGMWSHL